MKIIQIEESAFERIGTERCYPKQRYPNPDMPDSIGVVIIRGTITTEPSLLRCEKLEWNGHCGVSHHYCDGPIPSKREVREQIEGNWREHEMVGKDHKIRLVHLPKIRLERVRRRPRREEIYRVVEPKKERGKKKSVK